MTKTRLLKQGFEYYLITSLPCDQPWKIKPIRKIFPAPEQFPSTHLFPLPCLFPARKSLLSKGVQSASVRHTREMLLQLHLHGSWRAELHCSYCNGKKGFPYPTPLGNCWKEWKDNSVFNRMSPENWCILLVTVKYFMSKENEWWKRRKAMKEVWKTQFPKEMMVGNSDREKENWSL